MKRIAAFVFLLICFTAYFQVISTSAQVPAGTTYFISPSGSDANPGMSQATPWQSFNRAWQTITPGDTLVLLDGVYHQSFAPTVTGTAAAPITVRAQNDGQAIIDGDTQRDPFTLAGNISYYVVEGIIARNGNAVRGRHVIEVNGDHNILRRISAYDSWTDGNSFVINFGFSAEYNLLEDCISAGTGRKMIQVFKGENNTIRRCVAYWQAYDSREDCGPWPNGGSITIYNASYNIVENSITIGPSPKNNILVGANDPAAGANGNKVLGSIAAFAGMDLDGTIHDYGGSRPQPTSCAENPPGFYSQPYFRGGFQLYSTGEVRDNLFQDILAWGNAGYGLQFAPRWDDGYIRENNRVVRASIYNNGLDNAAMFGGIGADAAQEDLVDFTSIEDSFIEDIYVGGSTYTSMNGGGARLTNRYVDGVLTSEPLWPWPMEDCIQAELGISITDLISPLVFADSFTLEADPAYATVEPGDAIDVTLNMSRLGGFDEAIALSTNDPSGDLDIALSSTIVNSLPATVIMTLTDLHPVNYGSGAFYSVRVTASGGGITKMVDVTLLVNGRNVHLPIIYK